MASTSVMIQNPTDGPNNRQASIAPRKWPLVPPPIGKLIICAAKMKAADIPARGTNRSANRRLACTIVAAPTAADTPYVAAATGRERNPSGMCISTPP